MTGPIEGMTDIMLPSLSSIVRKGAIGLLLLGSHANGLLKARATDGGSNWITIWGSMPQLTEPANLPPPPFVSWSSSRLVY
jgi:hypothetical protein